MAMCKLKSINLGRTLTIKNLNYLINCLYVALITSQLMSMCPKKKQAQELMKSGNYDILCQARHIIVSIKYCAMPIMMSQ